VAARAPAAPAPNDDGAERRGSWPALAACFALASGTLLATHPWDLPVLVLVSTLTLIAPGHGRWRAAAWLGGGIVAGSIAFAPFLSGVRQSGRVLALVRQPSRPDEWCLAFGPFVLLALFGGGILVAARRRGALSPLSWSAAPALAAGGLLAALACEAVYVRDFFAATDLARMNTVFKVHRLSWTLFGTAAPVLVARLGALPRPFRRTGRLVIALALLAAAVYPVLGTRSWLAFRSRLAREAGANGAAEAAEPGARAEDLFRALFPGDAAVVAYLEKHAEPGEVALEETGEAYTWSSRIASFSGVPTVLGWGNHEAGWRDAWDPVLERQKKIESIYRDPQSERARALLRALRVRWVVVGARERERYGSEGPALLDRVGERVVESGGSALYRIDP
jgi:uncharacterized membrane protein